MLTRQLKLPDSAQSCKPSEDRFSVIDETPSLGDAFVAAIPVSTNLTPAFDDDPQTIERADNWLFSENSPDARDDECFPTASAIAVILREQGLSIMRDGAQSDAKGAADVQ